MAKSSFLPSIFDSGAGNNGIPDNPFKMPPDEKIFTFKEEEKMRRTEMRRKNEELKIWEKNRPPREGCLRRLLEKEIEPTGIAINPNVKKKISVAEAAHAAIPHERRPNRETRHKMIEKKREMFFIQKMLDYKKKEIAKLEEYALLREDGLNYSEKMLEKDLKEFTSFLEKNKESRHKATKEAELITQKKNHKINVIKQLQEDQAAYQSEMGKNLEALNNCVKYKKFLDELAPKELVAEKEKERMEREIAKQKEREKERSMISHAESKKFAAVASPSKKRLDIIQEEDGQATPRTEKGKRKRKEKVTDKYGFGDFGFHIESELQKILDNEDYDFPMYFSDPADLYKIFTNLEENNLFLIQTSQEIEQQLEEEKHKFKEMTEKYERTIEKLKKDQSELEIMIEEMEMNCKNLEEQSKGGSKFADEAKTYSDVKYGIKKNFQLLALKLGLKYDTNPLHLVQTLESKIEGYINTIEEYESISEENKLKITVLEKNMVKEHRNEDRKLKQDKDQLLKEIENQKRRENKKASYKFKQIGKKEMQRFLPYTKKKKAPKQNVKNDEKEELKYFIE